MSETQSCFDQFRGSIGYVPQRDIVHRKITIRRALSYAARLRFAARNGPEIRTSSLRVIR